MYDIMREYRIFQYYEMEIRIGVGDNTSCFVSSSEIE